MISIIIPTHNSAAHLSRALAPLAPAAMGGLVKEVIVADAGSSDATLALAEDSGCEIVRAGEGLAQWLVGLAAARGRWFLLMRAETALRPGWDEAALLFMREHHKRMRAAAFAPNNLLSRLRGPRGADGLLLSRTLYDALGGIHANDADESGLIRRIGRWRISYLG